VLIAGRRQASMSLIEAATMAGHVRRKRSTESMSLCFLQRTST
jgi:hypothetical protein